MVAARELRLVAAEAVEGVEPVVVSERLAEQLVGVVALVEGLLGGGVVERGDDGSFDAREAFETPGNVGDLVDEI